jgi:hypothetical protein
VFEFVATNDQVDESEAVEEAEGDTKRLAERDADGLAYSDFEEDIEAEAINEEELDGEFVEVCDRLADALIEIDAVGVRLLEALLDGNEECEVEGDEEILVEELAVLLAVAVAVCVGADVRLPLAL